VVEDVDIDKPFCRLLHFRRELTGRLARRPADPRVLVRRPAVGPSRDAAARHRPRAAARARRLDHRLDRRAPGAVSKGPFHLDDYVAYVREFVAFLGPDVHLISVCQPTVPGARRGVADGLRQGPAPAALDDHDGRADRHARNPTQVNALATRKNHAWFENNVIFTVPSSHPGYLAQGLPGLPAARRFRGDESRPHLNFALGLLQRPRQGDLDDVEAHRAFYDEYNAVLDLRPSTTWTRSGSSSRSTGCPPAPGRCAASRCAAGHPHGGAVHRRGELDDISGSGQTQAAHDLCSAIPKQIEAAPDRRRRRHYGIFSGPPLAGDDLSRIRDFIRTHN